MPTITRPHAPGYGIVGPEQGKLLPWNWAAERLSNARNYFISTVRPDGWPHVMIVWGLWMDNAFYFSTGRKSRKGRNLAGNPRCVVCPEDAREGVILEGTAEEVTDPEARTEFTEAYYAKYQWDIPKNEPVFAVRPRVVFGLIEKEFTTSATRWTFNGA
ncbi:MAG TPA: pyridoxamine 5'-phosphate oxidase family protein [Terriglobales bacterium]|nr:pyridoxamine 5'-phosphate oxidase family protein [Terriglobales bacterium]